MKLVNSNRLMQAAAVLTTALFLTATRPALAQDYPPPPSFSPQQLDSVVSRIALYPDPLLAQVLAAASFPDQIQDAARWADQYRNLRGNELADAMYQANLPFDPAVQALIPFPSVLDMMAQDLNWTNALGNAVLADRDQVMDAVQRMRRSAAQYGYLRNNDQLRVAYQGPDIEIEPVDPGLIYVPQYDPYVVYAPPRPGFFVGAAIDFGPCYSIGAFGGWGWGGGFNWYNHSLIVNRVVWGRTWYNRGAYVHNYGNWDRGAWRGNLEAHRDFYHEGRNNQGIQNRGFERSDRGQFNNNYRPAQPAPVTQNRGFERNNSAQFNNNYRPAQPAPVTQNRGFERNNSAQFNNSYRPAQPAPVTQNRGFERNNSAQFNNNYRPAQPAPVTQNRGFERNNSAQFNNNYRPAQPAPVTQNRGFERNNSAQFNNDYRPAQPAPVTQNRGFERNNSAQFNNNYRPAQPAPVTQNRGFQRNTFSQPRTEFHAQPAPQAQRQSFAAPRGNEGAHIERGGRR